MPTLPAATSPISSRMSTCILFCELCFGDSACCVILTHTLWGCLFLQRHTWAQSREVICLREIMHPVMSLSKCTWNAPCSFFCLYKMRSAENGRGNDWRGNTGRVYFIHPSSFSVLCLPPHHVTALIKNMLTHSLACVSPPPRVFSPSIPSSVPVSLLCPHPHYSVSSRPLPPSGGLAVLS